MGWLDRRLFIAGAKRMVPLVLGAVPFGIIYGTLATKNGLSIGHTMALSLLVFATLAGVLVGSAARALLALRRFQCSEGRE